MVKKQNIDNGKQLAVSAEYCSRFTVEANSRKKLKRFYKFSICIGNACTIYSHVSLSFLLIIQNLQKLIIESEEHKRISQDVQLPTLPRLPIC